MQLKTIASFEDSCSALSAYAGSYAVNQKVETLSGAAQLTPRVRNASLPSRTTHTEGLPLQESHYGDKRRGNPGVTSRWSELGRMPVVNRRPHPTGTWIVDMLVVSCNCFARILGKVYRADDTQLLYLYHG